MIEIKIEDLVMKCPDCEGAGQRKAEPTSNRGGIGSHTVRVMGECSKCFGTGEVMTESGKAIRAFINKNLDR